MKHPLVNHPWRMVRTLGANCSPTVMVALVTLATTATTAEFGAHRRRFQAPQNTQTPQSVRSSPLSSRQGTRRTGRWLKKYYGFFSVAVSRCSAGRKDLASATRGERGSSGQKEHLDRHDVCATQGVKLHVTTHFKRAMTSLPGYSWTYHPFFGLIEDTPFLHHSKYHSFMSRLNGGFLIYSVINPFFVCTIEYLDTYSKRSGLYTIHRMRNLVFSLIGLEVLKI